jgi:hypothetical protein
MGAPLGLATGYNAGFSRQWGSSETVNLYKENGTDGNANDKALIGTPGSVAIPDWAAAQYSDGQGRGIYTSSRGVIYCVMGAGIYKMTGEGVSPLKVYTIPDSITTCAFADDGINVSVVDGTALYLINMFNNTGSSPTLPNDIHPSHVEVCSGRTVINCASYTGVVVAGAAPPDTKIYYSELYDASVWTSGTAGSKAAIMSSDPLQAFALINDQLICMGPKSIEFIAPDPDSSEVPFSRVSGSTIGNGIYAPQSLKVIGAQAFWLGVKQNGAVQVYRTNGYNIEAASTPAIEFAFGAYNGQNASDAVASVYSEAGHTFYVLTSTNLGVSYVYDTVADSWHRRWSTINGTDRSKYIHQYFTSFNGKNYACGFYRGVVAIDITAYTEFDGTQIERLKSIPVIQESLNGIVHNNLILLCQSGVGNEDGTDGFDKDPKIRLSCSEDAGENWSPEIEQRMGNQGEAGRRLVWWMLGYARQRTYRFRSTAAVKHVWIEAYLNSTNTGM